MKRSVVCEVGTLEGSVGFLDGQGEVRAPVFVVCDWCVQEEVGHIS